MLLTFTITMLGTWLSCSLSQPLLTQPPSVTAVPGQNAKIPCTLRTQESFEIYRVFWLQQRPGQAPRLIYHFRSGSSQGVGPGVPNRFSVSADAAAKRWNLDIAGVSVDDYAAFYCCTYFDSTVGIIGDGTQLNVLSGETKAPTLSIFPPSAEEISGAKATLVCQGQNYYPAGLVWSWTVNGQPINTGVDSTRASKQAENNLFMAASFLSIDAVDWNANKLYTCTATHEGKAFRASVKLSECV